MKTTTTVGLLALLTACALTPEQRQARIARIAGDLEADLKLAQDLVGAEAPDLLLDLEVAARMVRLAASGGEVGEWRDVLEAAKGALPEIADHLVARGVDPDRVLLYTVGARRILSRAEEWFAGGF